MYCLGGYVNEPPYSSIQYSSAEVFDWKQTNINLQLSKSLIHNLFPQVLKKRASWFFLKSDKNSFLFAEVIFF